MSWTRLLYFISVLLSSGVMVYKNGVTDIELHKRGYLFKGDKSLKKILFSFFKDYSYLFVPVMNLCVSITEGLRNKEDYLKERLNKLLLRGRLEKEEDAAKTNEKIEEKKETKTEEKVEEKKETKTEEKVLTIDELPIEDQIKYYEKLDNEYRLEHSRIPKTKENIKRRNELVREVKGIEEKLSSLYRQLEIKKLKEERERLTSHSRSK